MPADWAMTQMNLGNTILTWSRLRGGAEGRRALNEAIDCYRGALEVRMREPADRATTRMNLGNALLERARGAPGRKATSTRAMTARRTQRARSPRVLCGEASPLRGGVAPHLFVKTCRLLASCHAWLGDWRQAAEAVEATCRPSTTASRRPKAGASGKGSYGQFQARARSARWPG